MSSFMRAALALTALLLWTAPAQAEDQQLMGKIVSRAGKTLTVAPAAGSPEPTVGAEGKLSKPFSPALGKLKISGWLEIARVSVKATGKNVTLTILEERSKMKVNGKPVNHFKPGTAVKLTWQ
jgi:hypothetical protein